MGHLVLEKEYIIFSGRCS